MSLAMTAGTVSSVILAASNLPMIVKARRTRDLSSYSLPYLVLNNAGRPGTATRHGPRPAAPVPPRR